MKKRDNFIYWALDLLALLLIGTIWLADYLRLSAAWEQTLQIIAIMGVYGLIVWSWQANPKAMVEPRSTEDKQATEWDDAEPGPHLNEVQANYRHVIGIN
jgi:cyanate permease